MRLLKSLFSRGNQGTGEVAKASEPSQGKADVISDNELRATRKYLQYLAINWWAGQPESRKTATCDACGGRSVSRNDGYLIGSSLWCEDCYRERDVEGQIRRNPNSLGYGVFQKALDMFGKE